MEKIAVLFLRKFIFLYQKGISPFIGKNCRYFPTCSEYCTKALQSYGLLKGTWLGIKRILRCHPWGEQGYDPLSLVKKNQK